MLDLVLIVLLVAWFFGISYGAALHGILNFALWAIVIGAILAVVTWALALVPDPAQKAKPKKATKPAKKHPALRWLAFFLTSYLITGLFFTAIGIWETPHITAWHLVMIILLPALPFSIVAAYYLGRKMTARKKRTR